MQGFTIATEWGRGILCGSGATAFTYEADKDRVASVDGPFENDTIAYAWDAAGRRTGTTLSDDPNAGGALRTAISYTYDALGRMATVTSPTPDSGLGTPHSWTYSYLGASTQVTELAMPRGIATTRTYDALGRLASVSTAAVPAADRCRIEFAYDGNGNARRPSLELGQPVRPRRVRAV